METITKAIVLLSFAMSMVAAADEVSRHKEEIAFAAGYGIHYTVYETLGKQTRLSPVVRWLISTAAAGGTAALMERPILTGAGAALSTAVIITF
jgi:2-methylcitrate dehydratase PrpD